MKVLSKTTLHQTLQRLSEPECGWRSFQLNLNELKDLDVDTTLVGWLLDILDDRQENPAVRVTALQTLAFHKPWSRLEHLDDERIQGIPEHFLALLKDPDRDLWLREQLVPLVGWQTLLEDGCWSTLLEDPNPALRREVGLEIIAAPERSVATGLIEHLLHESDSQVQNSLLWAISQHPLTLEALFLLLEANPQESYLALAQQIIEQDLAVYLEKLVQADLRFLDIREALLKRITHNLNRKRIIDLLDLLYQQGYRPALRILRHLPADRAGQVLQALQTYLPHHSSDEMELNATKLALHYRNQYPGLRYQSQTLIDNLQARNLKVFRLLLDQGMT